MILVFGSVNIDLVARVPSIPRPGETVLSPRYATVFGGKGANQAVAAARASRPGRVAMAARVGDDAFGRAARDNLAANGVDIALVESGAEPTGCAFITVDAQGENAITVASGANAALTEAAVPDLALREATLVLQMEVPFAESLKVARRAKAAGGRVLWNLAPAPADLAPDDLTDLLAVTDVLIVNEYEAAAAVALLGLEAAGTESGGAALAAAGGCTCVVTAGAGGAFAYHADGRREHAPATPVTTVDTTGAGDTFVGILASGLDEGLAFSAALRRACFGASQACSSPGAQAGMPTRESLAG